MASESRVFYNPYLLNECKGELENEGILLPPLDIASTSERRRWKKKGIITGIIFCVICVLITAAVIVDLSIYSDRSEESITSDEKEMEKSTKPVLNFEIDLHRIYNKIRRENTPDVLKTLFDYYKYELSEVKDVESLKEYLVLLRSEGLLKAPYNLTQSDVLYTLQLTGKLHDWYTYLSSVENNMRKYETQNNPSKPAVMPTVKMDIMQNRELNGILKRYAKLTLTVVTDTRTTFKSNIILISEVLKLLETDAKLRKPEIFIFATDIIYLDSDITLPQTSVALIAPRWSFVKDVAIFVSGLNGLQHMPDTANAGDHGLPGNSGGNGGLFIGVGSFDRNSLHVYSDGGDGGDGQHGSVGRNGTNTRPNDFITADPYSCKRHLEDIKNMYGEVISYFLVYDSYGCGANGTDGGFPGQGGEAGDIVIMDVEEGVVSFERGNKGTDGKGGKGGIGGKGAQTGCYFYAERNRQGRPYQITTRLCGVSMPSGRNGRDGYNRGVKEDTHKNLTFFTDALKEYRLFAMEEYLNGNKNIWNFIVKLDEIPHYNNLTNTRDLINELEYIDGIGNIEFYESIHRRIDKAWKHSKSKDLTYLRALSYGKLLNQKHRLDKYIIVDLDIFLETILNDLQSMDGTSLTHKDHTLPILIQLLREKVDFLKDSLSRWADKTRKLLLSFDLFPTEVSKKIDVKKMIYLTLTAAEVLKPDWLLEYSSRKVENYTFPDLDASLSKTFNPRFSRHQELVLRELKAVSYGGANLRIRMKNLKNLMRILNDLVDNECELSDFTFDLEYFEITTEVAEIVHEKQNFNKYLSDVARLVTRDERMEQYLLQTLILSRYKDAVNVFRQWVFPHMYAYEQFLPKKNLTLDVAKTSINLLRKWIREYKSTITSYDKYIREAVFSSKNSVGTFYKWDVSEIHSEMIELLKGRKIQLTSDVENEHIFNKNAIKFKTVRIEFHSSNLNLYKLMKNVQVEMRHSGYSYFYYNGQIYIQNGEGFDLRYSYELGNDGEPINCNMVYKKLMISPPIFSPYTTWTIQLKNIPDDLWKLSDNINITLVGSGSYIETTDYLI